jgi:hypothetical protein
MSNPYQNFLEALNSDNNPNFLWYILIVLEKHSYAQQAELFKALRERLEKRYDLEARNIWEEKS